MRHWLMRTGFGLTLMAGLIAATVDAADPVDPKAAPADPKADPKGTEGRPQGRSETDRPEQPVRRHDAGSFPGCPRARYRFRTENALAELRLGQ